MPVPALSAFWEPAIGYSRDEERLYRCGFTAVSRRRFDANRYRIRCVQPKQEDRRHVLCDSRRGLWVGALARERAARIWQEPRSINLLGRQWLPQAS